MTGEERKKRVEKSTQCVYHWPANSNWEDNLKKLAGYLNFIGSLEAVRRFLNEQEGSQESRGIVMG